MTDYTIISNSDEKNSASVVIEYAVPGTGTNVAGIQWQTIVADLRAFNGETGTANPNKKDDAAYIGQLDAGALLELTLTVQYSANLDNAGKAAAIDAAVTTRVASFVDEFQNTYEFYGTERTV